MEDNDTDFKKWLTIRNFNDAIDGLVELGMNDEMKSIIAIRNDLETKFDKEGQSWRMVNEQITLRMR